MSQAGGGMAGHCRCQGRRGRGQGRRWRAAGVESPALHAARRGLGRRWWVARSRSQHRRGGARRFGGGAGWVQGTARGGDWRGRGGPARAWARSWGGVGHGVGVVRCGARCGRGAKRGTARAAGHASTEIQMNGGSSTPARSSIPRSDAEVVDGELVGGTDLGKGRGRRMELDRDGRRESGRGHVAWAGGGDAGGNAESPTLVLDN
ncbi:uncharacterized protein [Miscanthus floridulus]|uniref:uncharacterized protein n=1 Tax=Miscanthus floridulus TaxID=154761 RepID=UPI0034597FA4